MTRCQSLTFAILFGTAGLAHATHCPNVMFVLDQSGSMADDPSGKQGNGKSKWSLLQDAVKAIVGKYGDQVPFGLELFTSGGADDLTCYSDTRISVEPAHDTKQQIIQIISAAKPDSGTNTGEAIKRAAVDPVMHDKTRSDFIVLITDGDPNCNTGDQSLNGSPTYTLGQIKAATASGIKTFVIGFDGSAKGVNPANLNSMAVAGGEPIAGCAANQAAPCYYSASNATKFNTAINAIVDQVVGGEFGMTMCDDSCASSGCQTGYVCATDELNTKPHCSPDPCANVKDSCGPNQYCRGGGCVDACPNACPTSQICKDGQCIVDPCHGVTCGDGQVCDPSSGACVSNPCINLNCKAPTICDVTSGTCIDDQCHIITCPANTECVAGGNCVGTMAAPSTPSGDPGASGRQGVGCALGGRSGVGAMMASLIALGLVALLRRRRD